ncbi:transcription factor GTE6 isoform X3 [Arachis ipaensis]|uniref:transcription factor GTE6 isoform X3 n=1 Tax=Arachis ipaensis TaxID=130454 RepID=UPI000A2B8D25|nr:transcription factor GTE6 isoform X3 [Arachis ipaensis]XP_025655076.1 transcription factor GTE6 isoform X3 [Arachis hypogaea]
MDTFGASISEAKNITTGNPYDCLIEMEGFKCRVDDIISKVDELEQKVNDIEIFFSSTNKRQKNMDKGNSSTKDKDKEKHVASIKKQNKVASRREAAAAKRMQDLMRQFGTILRQVIDKPMDFSTIKNQTEAKDGTGYKNVREICVDVRLVFTNAMKYNDEKSDVHVMAKTLLEKFEEKWLQFLPKVTEEETRREQEEAEAQLSMQLAQEAAHARMARDLSNEILLIHVLNLLKRLNLLSFQLYDVDVHLEELREMAVKKFRKMTTDEKRKLGAALARLSPEDLSKALEIVAQNNPSFQATAEEVDLDIDAQSQSTLWKLKYFIEEALEKQSKNSGSTSGNENHNNKNKRKQELCDAVAKASKNKKPT